MALIWSLERKRSIQSPLGERLLRTVRQRHFESADRHRDEAVIAENADEIDEGAAPQHFLSFRISLRRDAMRRPKLVREGIDAALVVAHEFGGGAAADFLDEARRQSRTRGNRRMDMPFESGAPECASDEDREFGEPRLKRRAKTAEGAERLRPISQRRGVQPNAQRSLHHAARAGDDRVMDALPLLVERGGIDVGQTRHGIPSGHWMKVAKTISSSHGKSE